MSHLLALFAYVLRKRTEWYQNGKVEEEWPEYLQELNSLGLQEVIGWAVFLLPNHVHILISLEKRFIYLCFCHSPLD
jgi:REP element-mobilizing transposase RayT